MNDRDRLRIEAFERYWQRRHVRDIQLRRIIEATSFVLAVCAFAGALAIVLGVL